MKKTIITTLLGMALISSSSFTLANTNSPGVDNRQENQKNRIVQGVKPGELTGKETFRLGKQQARINNKEQRFKADGELTRGERVNLHRSLNRSSKNIYKQKHDRQIQGGRPHGIKSPGVNKRQRNQTRRIGQGVRSGELTARETVRLGKQQARIRHQERRFKSDGHFTKRERAKVHKNLNRASKNIYRKKHNNRSR